MEAAQHGDLKRARSLIGYASDEQAKRELRRRVDARVITLETFASPEHREVLRKYTPAILVAVDGAIKRAEEQTDVRAEGYSLKLMTTVRHILTTHNYDDRSLRSVTDLLDAMEASRTTSEREPEGPHMRFDDLGI
jgi:hypothetical protein